MTYKIDVEPFGEVEVKETLRSKRILLKVYPDGRIRVSAPPKTEPKAIYTFISLNKEGIAGALRRSERRHETCAKRVIFRPGTAFHTRQRSLQIEPQEGGGKPQSAKITYDKIRVYYTADTDIEGLLFQKFVHKVIDAALKNEAEKYLPQRTAELAAKHGLTYSHVALRNMTSQWGSCSTNGRICLNIQLMRLPDELIDLVILHELTHTVHFDHSKAFYAMLDSLLGGRHDELNKRLKSLSTQY